MMSKIIVVTRRAGFIESSVVCELINYMNHVVVNVDKLTYTRNLEFLKETDGQPQKTFENGIKKTVQLYLEKHVQDGSYQRLRLGRNTI